MLAYNYHFEFLLSVVLGGFYHSMQSVGLISNHEIGYFSCVKYNNKYTIATGAVEICVNITKVQIGTKIKLLNKDFDLLKRNTKGLIMQLIQTEFKSFQTCENYK